MRGIFTDSENSAAHVALGFAAGKPLVVPFCFYQFILQGDENATVDTVEFLAGWLAAVLLGYKAGALAGK